VPTPTIKRGTMHKAKWALIACIPLSTVACIGGLKDYIQPDDNASARIVVVNDSTHTLGLHIYENGVDCSQKRRVIRIEPSAEYKFNAKSSAPTAYSMSVETGKTFSNVGKIINIRTYYCRSMFSFSPDPKGEYRIKYHDAPTGCDIKATKKTVDGPKLVELTMRTFHRPFDDDGAFCLPLSSPAE